ncbi:MAG: hypothetical protein M0P72_14555 [Metallibacterium scheffleri]|jgi:hypothetical protein|uniref:hypothetical protein n=1 Tax=Metallibacterium scheffleri TaxID=993689 RepID=UPI0026F0E03E|nr:hypothetical protein [Metallibacterium scheffleri]MCK9368352.1 hypothetical protein [Metallibacterium scheffleri]
MTDRHLFLASTPLIALEAAGAALEQGGRAQLVLLEDFDLASRLAGLLRRWPDRPFEMIHELPGRYTEHQLRAGANRSGLRRALHRVLVKRAIRAQTLSCLEAIEAEFAPGSVWVGNDRKVEAQYALHLAARRLHQRPGRYLDDGLYTYLGRLRQRPLVRRVDWLVKGLSYGRWGQPVAQLGTSRWIDQAWLAFPDQAVDQDPARQRRTLPREWFTSRAFRRLSALAAREFAVDRAVLRQCAVVLVLPHSNLIKADPATSAALVRFIAEAGQGNVRVALKYHPREVDADPAGLLAACGNATALPRLLPMELLLPLLPRGALLAGESSTALLAARWLRPDLQVFDLGVSRSGYARRARAFFQQHGIPTVAGDLGMLRQDHLAGSAAPPGHDASRPLVASLP